MKKELTLQEWGMMIGQEVYVDELGVDTFVLVGLKQLKNDIVLYGSNGEAAYATFCKPILRTLDQMTEEEWDDFSKVWWKKDAEVDWLTQKGFDIRNWINAGLAVKKED